MVQVVKADRGPLVHIHYIERTVHGNGIAVKVWGEMKICGKEIVYARELKLNTIEVLLLTPKTGAHGLYHVNKWVHSEGEYDNYASVDILVPSGTVDELAGPQRTTTIPAPTTLPADGSIWLDFHALGE